MHLPMRRNIHIWEKARSCNANDAKISHHAYVIHQMERYIILGECDFL